MSNEKEPCPLCGALPGDWVDDPHENLALFCNVDRAPLVATDPLFMALADLRVKTGVGEKPMLSELPKVIADRISELTDALTFYKEAWSVVFSTKHKGTGGLTYKPSETLLDDCGNRAHQVLSKKW